jgi:hypothetical protein
MGIFRTTNPLEFDDVDGIIVNETAPAPNIQGVSANIAILVGQFQRGPVNELTEVGSIAQFHEIFGKSEATGNRELKNKKFGRLRLIRAAASAAATASLNLQDDTPEDVLTVSAKYPGVYGNSITVLVEAGSDSGNKYTFTDTSAGAVLPAEVYDNVSIADLTDTQLNEIFGTSQLVVVTGAGSAEPEPLTATALAAGSDGTIADTDYETAIAVAEQERAGNILFTDKYSSTIKDALEQHVLNSPDKIVVMAPDDDTVTLAGAITEVAGYRNTEGRIVYAFNHLQTRINGVLVYTSPASWLASVMSNIAPNIDPAFAANVQFAAGVTDMKNKLTRAEYIQAKDAGIAAWNSIQTLVATRSSLESRLRFLTAPKSPFFDDEWLIFTATAWLFSLKTIRTLQTLRPTETWSRVRLWLSMTA